MKRNIYIFFVISICFLFSYDLKAKGLAKLEVMDLKEFYTSKTNQKNLLSKTTDPQEKVFLQQFFARLDQIKTNAYLYRGQLFLESANRKQSHRIVPIIFNEIYDVDGKIVIISPKATTPYEISKELVENINFNTEVSTLSLFVSPAFAADQDATLWLRLAQNGEYEWTDDVTKPGFVSHEIVSDNHSRRFDLRKYFKELDSQILCEKGNIARARGSSLALSHQKPNNFSTVGFDNSSYLKVIRAKGLYKLGETQGNTIEFCNYINGKCRPATDKDLEALSNKKTGLLNSFKMRGNLFGFDAKQMRKELVYASDAITIAADCCNNTTCRERIKEHLGKELYDSPSTPIKRAQ